MTAKGTTTAAGGLVAGEAGGRLMRLATYASVSVAVTLIAFKLAAYLATGSVSMLSTLVDSLLDAGASLINLFAVRHSLSPADREHRFGHGKAEPLAGLAQAAFIAGSAVFLLIEAGDRLINPVPVSNGVLGIAVMVVAIVLTLVLVQFQRSVIRRTQSVAIKADSLHYVGDVLVNLSVIAALLLDMTFGWQIADPLFAIAIAAFIIWNAWKIVKQALDQLMDRELPEDARARIYAIAMSHEEVRGVHELRTRRSGRDAFIQLHLELDGDLPLRHAHEIADQVELAIREEFPDSEVIIHQDPEGLLEEHKIAAPAD